MQPTAFWRRWAIEGFEYDECPNLKAWKERIDARPATQVLYLAYHQAVPCLACRSTATHKGLRLKTPGPPEFCSSRAR
jgi:hypothetical protein